MKEVLENNNTFSGKKEVMDSTVLDRMINQTRERLLNKEELTLKEYYNIIKNLIDTNNYNVDWLQRSMEIQNTEWYVLINISDRDYMVINCAIANDRISFKITPDWILIDNFWSNLPVSSLNKNIIHSDNPNKAIWFIKDYIFSL